MAIEILNGSMKIEIFYDRQDRDYEDNICVCIKEAGPEDEKIMYANETNMFITADQARRLADMLLKSADQSDHATR
jgi:hypothetical protein